MKRVRKKANLASVEEPQLVTLTRSPANRIGFKVIRSAEEVQRNDNFLISIELPPEITEEQALALASEYGLNEQYQLVKKNNRYVLQRDDADLDPEAVDPVKIRLSDDVIANVSPTAFQRSEEFVENEAEVDENDTRDNQAIRLISVRFDNALFTNPADVDAWLKENNIDYPAGGVEQRDDGYWVTRSEPEGDTREVAFADGVTGVICRAATLDYPNALYGRTVEQAYGDWGWGHLDFTAMAADVEFTERADEAIVTLNRVLSNIVIGSELPLDTRKQLIVNAVSSYAGYTIGLIDALPRAVIEQTRSDEQTNGQENDMSTEETKAAESESVDTTVERTDEAVTEEQGEAKAESQDFVTRSELKEVVAEAIAEALPKQEEAATEETTEEATRSDEESADDESKLDKLIGVVGEMATAMKDMQEEQKSLRSDLDAVDGETTVSRSTESDGAPAEEPVEKANVFEGMFGKLGN